jgi:hypothetical protein
VVVRGAGLSSAGIPVLELGAAEVADYCLLNVWAMPSSSKTEIDSGCDCWKTFVWTGRKFFTPPGDFEISGRPF